MCSLAAELSIQPVIGGPPFLLEVFLKLYKALVSSKYVGIVHRVYEAKKEILTSYLREEITKQCTFLLVPH